MTTTRVDLHYDHEWHDITTDVRLTAQHNGITINRGRDNEQAAVSPSRCSLWLNNTGGTYSPRNPSSSLYGKIGRNSRIRVVTELVSDAFGRTSASGWGSADTGQAWTSSGGDAVDYTVGSGVGTIAIDTVNAIREVYLGDVSRRDITVSATLSPGQVATGDTIQMAVVARRQDASNYYYCIAVFGTDSTASLVIAKRVSGSPTWLVTADTTLTYTAATSVRVELTVSGSYLTATMWDVASPSATTSVDTVDTAITAAGAVGVRAAVGASNTNTLPVSVTVDDFAVDDVRFVGEVPSWPNRWDVTGRDVWVPVEAAGIMRRLGGAAAPLRSALYRTITTGGWDDLNPGTLRAYWPMEDETGSTQAASGTGRQAMYQSGSITWASSGPGGSDSLPDFSAGTGRLIGNVPNFAVSTSQGWWAFCVFKVSGSSVAFIPFEILCTGTLPLWRVTISSTGVTLSAKDRNEANQINVAVAGSWADGEWHTVIIDAYRTSATQVTGTLYVDDTNTTNGSASSYTIGAPRKVTVPTGTPTNTTTALVGHLAVYSRTSTTGPGSLYTDGGHVDALGGYTAEKAGTRYRRLCSEQGVPAAITGSATDTAAVGAQRVTTLQTLLQDCADVDQGILYEPRALLGYGYRTLVGLCNQTATLALDYTASQLVPPFEPTEDDQHLRNKVTATRIGGSSQTVTVDEGTLSTADPPDGVGEYAASVSVNAEGDGQLADIAGWLTHLGTWDEARFERLTVELASSTFTTSTSLTYSALETDIGDVITVDNPPSWLPPDQIALLVQGYTEQINTLHTITYQCVPAGPYTTPTWGSSTSATDEASSPDHYDTAGSALASAATSGATTLSIATTNGPLWTTAAADLPFDLRIGGEQVTATAVANTTIAFVAAGTAAHADNASVAPGLPAGLAAGHLLLGWAAIRNTSGTVTTPSGYTAIVDFANCQLFGRIADGTESAPTVAFTGGSAGDDTSCQLAAFSGSFYDVSKLQVAGWAQLNASAQNISRPDLPVPVDNCLVLRLGWKQDDWTSISVPPGSTEIGSPTTTTGSDQGLVWDYTIQTSATDIAAGSWTVTGGAAALSRSILVALRSDVQSFTVTRSVNGVTKAQTAGTDVRLWTPGVWAR